MSQASNSVNVDFVWTQPGFHSSPILGYDLVILKAGGSFTVDSVNCNGNSTAVMQALSCSIPMLTLASLTTLPADSLIQAKVRARNSNGYGQYSQLNVAGVILETAPTQVSNLTFDFKLSNTTQVVLLWNS
jgi:hypothetical protein